MKSEANEPNAIIATATVAAAAAAAAAAATAILIESYKNGIL